MSSRTRHQIAAAILAATAGAALAPAAGAAPAWTAPHEVTGPTGMWTRSLIGFGSGGLQIQAGRADNPASPSQPAVGVAERGVPANLTGAFTFSPAPRVPLGVTLAVAPNGAAIVGWKEIVGVDNGPVIARAAYRTPAGVWESPLTLANEPEQAALGIPATAVTVAIGDDGTAVAGVTYPEADFAGEAETDDRIDVVLHQPTGGWGALTRLSAANKSSFDLKLGVEADGSVTAAFQSRVDEGDPDDTFDSRSAVTARRYSAASQAWAAAVQVSPLAATDTTRDLRLAVAPSGRAVIAYRLSTVAFAQETLVARRATGNVAFAAPATAVPGQAVHKNGPTDVGIAPDGTYYVVRLNDATNDLDVVRSPGNGAFSAPAILYNGGPPPEPGKVAFSGDDVFFAWSGWQGPNQAIQATTWAPGAAAPAPAENLESSVAGGRITQLLSDRDGSVVAVWETGQPVPTRFATFDGGAPRPRDVTVPSLGTAGEALAFGATFGDAWSPLAPTAWDFGDGSTASGDQVSHAYAGPGNYIVTVRGADTLGNAVTKTYPVTITPAPVPASDPVPQEPAGPGKPADPGKPLAPAAPLDAVAPTVTLALPACRKGLSKKACAKRRKTRKAWRTLTGKVTDAKPSAGIARIEVTAFRKGGKKRVLIASAKGGKWSRKLSKLTTGKWTFRVRAIDRAGHTGRTVQRTITLGA